MTKDHFGGLANDTLAKCAGISPGARVADFCAGLGGAGAVLRGRTRRRRNGYRAYPGAPAPPN
jgi:hypothetical protein